MLFQHPNDQPTITKIRSKHPQSIPHFKRTWKFNKSRNKKKRGSNPLKHKFESAHFHTAYTIRLPQKRLSLMYSTNILKGTTHNTSVINPSMPPPALFRAASVYGDLLSKGCFQNIYRVRLLGCGMNRNVGTCVFVNVRVQIERRYLDRRRLILFLYRVLIKLELRVISVPACLWCWKGI